METITELAKEYKISLEKLNKRYNELKNKLNEYYSNGIFLSNEILKIRKKLVIYEDMIVSVKSSLNRLENYYEICEDDS